MCGIGRYADIGLCKTHGEAVPRPSQDTVFQQIYRRHRDAVWAYCYRRLDHNEVEDAVAEVFTVAWRRRDSTPTGDEALPWLYGVSKNVVRNINRSSVRRNRLDVRVASATQASDDPSDVQVVRNLEDEELLEAVSRLSPDEQELLRLRTWEELSINDIAAVVGRSPRSVESKLARIRKKLARRFDVPSSLLRVVRPRYAEEGGER